MKHLFYSFVASCLISLLSFLGGGRLLAQRSPDYPYAPPWYGPHALPVPPIDLGLIPSVTEITPRLSTAIAPGHRTHALHIDLEVPLIPEAVSVRGWGVIQEAYSLSESEARRMEVPKGWETGFIGGDYFLQTRIRLLREKRLLPNVLLNITLKTAATTRGETHRYHDTPGYYFSIESGKDWIKTTELRLRTALQFGFLCWETGLPSRQDDAWMYGLQLSAAWRGLELRTDLSGYTGWKHGVYKPDYGDQPITWRMSLGYQLNQYCRLSADVEHGIRHYPFTLAGLGVKVSLPFLTPRFSVTR